MIELNKKDRAQYESFVQITSLMYLYFKQNKLCKSDIKCIINTILVLTGTKFTKVDVAFTDHLRHSDFMDDVIKEFDGIVDNFKEDGLI